MKLVAISASTSQFGNGLPLLHVFPFLHQDAPVVRVRTQVVLIVVDDNQIAVTQQPVTGINHVSIGGSLHRVTGISGNINAFVDFPGCRIFCNYGANVGPAPIDIRYGLALLRQLDTTIWLAGNLWCRLWFRPGASAGAGWARGRGA